MLCRACCHRGFPGGVLHSGSMSIEIHPGEGGDDAALFALELGRAIAKHSGGSVSNDGRVVVVTTSRRL